MIKTSSLNNKNILENLYRILRMSLLLGDAENRDETIVNFDDTARKLDNIDTANYNEELAKLSYTTVTLEEEQKKLEELIKYISKRIAERRQLVNEYKEVIGHDIDGLGMVQEADNLANYEIRLKNIQEYLDNTKKIDATNRELEELKEKLELEKDQKVDYESDNERMEDKLRKDFIEITKKIDSESYANITLNTITSDLQEIAKVIEESGQSLKIFTKSYETLRNAGISSQQEVEYAKYVREAREMYYNNREQEYILKLYQLILDIAVSFDSLYEKRRNINRLLEERLELRKQLNINTEDSLLPLYNELDEQFNFVTTEKTNVDNIASIEDQINFKTTKLANLEAANQKPEIIDLLKEFCLIDADKVPASPALEPVSEVSEPAIEVAPTLEEPSDTKLDEPLKPNAIVDISDIPDNMNLDIIKTKTNTVMKRVGEMLGLKDKTNKNEFALKNEPKVSKDDKETMVPSLEATKVVETPKQENTLGVNDDIIENVFWPEGNSTKTAKSTDNTRPELTMPELPGLN